MRRIVVWMMLWPIIVGGMATAAWAAGDDKPSGQEQEAWKAVDSLNGRSIQEFLKRFPEGERTGQAQVAYELQDRFSRIRQGGPEEVFIIPFEVLGETWKQWRKKCPDKGGIGYFVRKGDKKDTLGWFTPKPLSGGKTPVRSTYSFDDRGVLTSPTGDGSIVVFRTGGLRFEFIKGIVVETPGEEPIFFGVWEGRGLVHLRGSGKVVFPDGKAVELK